MSRTFLTLKLERMLFLSPVKALAQEHILQLA